MPSSHTIIRAMAVARWRSPRGPVVVSPSTSSSAAMPPMDTAIRASELLAAVTKRSSSGTIQVRPSAWPRLMIEILWTGSVPGSAQARMAWPPSW